MPGPRKHHSQLTKHRRLSASEKLVEVLGGATKKADRRLQRLKQERAAEREEDAAERREQTGQLLAELTRSRQAVEKLANAVNTLVEKQYGASLSETPTQ